MFTSYSVATFQPAEEGLDKFSWFKESEETIAIQAVGGYGQIRIFTLIKPFKENVLGLDVTANSGQKIVVKKVDKWHDLEKLFRQTFRPIGKKSRQRTAPYKNVQALFDTIKNSKPGEDEYVDYPVNDFDSLEQWLDDMMGGRPKSLENTIKKEASLQQRCASFKPRVAPYVYGLNEVYNSDNSKTHFIAMECMDKSLKQLLDEAPDLLQTLTDEFACQLLALCFKLFQHGISHNDLHAGNIMVNSIGRPYLIDFGWSKDNLSQYKSFKFKSQLLKRDLHPYLKVAENWGHIAEREGRIGKEKVDGLNVLDEDFPYKEQVKLGIELLTINDRHIRITPVFIPMKYDTSISKTGIFSLLGL